MQGSVPHTDTRQLDEAAQQLLSKNTQHVTEGGRQHTFTVPSSKTYPFQWFWDSCFHAIVWSRFDVRRAEEEIHSLLSAQHRDGFLPHIIYWDPSRVHRSPLLYPWQESKGWRTMLPFGPSPRTSALIQPPVLAQAVERVWERGHHRGFLEKALPQLDRYYSWLAQNRGPEKDGLLRILAPYESGVDASPSYDALLGVRPGMHRWRTHLAYRSVPLTNKVLFGYNQRAMMTFGKFQVVDVLVNAIYALNLQVLGALHRQLGQQEAAERWEQASRATLTALLDKCWDDQRGFFFNLDGRRLQRNTVLVIQGLLPLILPDLPRSIVERLVNDHLTNSAEFWLPFPVPSVAHCEPSFSAQSYLIGTGYRLLWRGSTWINTNWYLVHGLRLHGFHALADELAQKTRALVAQSGFREYFDPLTGEGLGAKQFGWSTLAADC